MTTKASALMVISGLDFTAFALAVYASQPGSPRLHARLASGWWLASAGRDLDPQDSSVGFRHRLHDFPLTQALPGATSVYLQIARRTPCSLRMALMVLRAISCPRSASASRIRVYPQPGLSRAIVATSSRSSSGFFGLPGLRRSLPSYFMAMSSRYQRRIVSGVTIQPSSRSISLCRALSPSPRDGTAARP